jgi:hypothetical protein
LSTCFILHHVFWLTQRNVSRFADESASVVHCDAKQRRWVLVGDAAFGLPFFRALNDGLLCVTELTRCIAMDYAVILAKNNTKTGAQDPGVLGGGGGGSRLLSSLPSLSATSVGAVSSSLSEVTGAGGPVAQDDGDPLSQYSSFFKSLTRKERLFVGVKAKVVGSAVKSFGATRVTKHAATRSVNTKRGGKQRMAEGIPPKG